MLCFVHTQGCIEKAFVLKDRALHVLWLCKGVLQTGSDNTDTPTRIDILVFGRCYVLKSILDTQTEHHSTTSVICISLNTNTVLLTNPFIKTQPLEHIAN